MRCHEIIPKSVVRLGRPITGHHRLLKLTIDLAANRHKLLGSTWSLREKNGNGNVNHRSSNIFITPDLTNEDREKNKKLKNHSGKCLRRFGGIYAYCRYFIDRKW